MQVDVTDDRFHRFLWPVRSNRADGFGSNCDHQYSGGSRPRTAAESQLSELSPIPVDTYW